MKIVKLRIMNLCDTCNNNRSQWNGDNYCNSTKAQYRIITEYIPVEFLEDANNNNFIIACSDYDECEIK